MLHTFTSGRDYKPHAAFPTAVPPNTQYVRVIVAAHSIDDASDALDMYHLARYTETLRGPNEPDGPAEAVAAYVRDEGIDQPTVFVVYRIDSDELGKALNPPRLLVAQLRGSVAAVIGRVRIVGKGRPDQPYPQCRIVPVEAGPDPVALAGTEYEGPTDDVPMVEGPAAFPATPVGYLAKGREWRLLAGLADVQAELGQAIAGIERNRRSMDPRLSYARHSERLLALSAQLAALAGDAAVVEVVLQAGN